MEWLVDTKQGWAEWLAMKVLRVGPIPKHLAVIMDGNRRYAKLLEKGPLEGHKDGFKKLTQVLAWCRNLGIREVTAYAFSIENFKRSKAEVDGLMNLAEEKFHLLLEQRSMFAEYGVRINAIGNLGMLSATLRSLAAEAMSLTKDNDQFVLNLAIAYTSREEMCNAIKELRRGVDHALIEVSDIDKDLFEECLYTAESRHPPDLLIRTSGESRLSDFLLWQTQFAHLVFTKILWPELSVWHLCGAVFHYQRYHHKVAAMRHISYPRQYTDDHPLVADGKDLRKMEFVRDLRARRRAALNIT